MNTRSTAPGCHPDAAAVAPAGQAEPNPASPEEATAADNGGDKVVPVVPRAGCNQAPTALAGTSVAAAVAGCEDVVAAPADPPAFGAAGDAADAAGLPTEATTAVRRPLPPAKEKDAEDDAALPAGDEPGPGRVAREGPEGRAGPAFTDGPDSRDPLSAHATAGRTAIPTPTPNAAARAPTRPTDRASHTGGDCRARRDSAQPTGKILTTTARHPSREHSGARIPPARHIAFDHQRQTIPATYHRSITQARRADTETMGCADITALTRRPPPANRSTGRRALRIIAASWSLR